MQGEKTMTLLNMTYNPKCNFNLISLGQSHKSGILYYDHLNFMILKKENSILRIANKYKNLFVVVTSSRVILIKRKDRLPP